MSGVTLDKLLFDPASPADSPLVGSYLLGSTGTVIDDTSGDLHVLIQNASLAVTATDLDIRDLVNTQDSIAIGDETNLVDLEISDAAFVGGYGFSMYGVRQDAAGSPVSADGDAHPFVFNDDGQLKTTAEISSDFADDAADGGNPIKVGSRAVDGALTAVSASNDRADLLSDLYRRVWVNDAPNIAMNNEAASVTSTAAELVSTPLAGRKRILIQNTGDDSVYIGKDGTVTSSNGIEIPKKASFEVPFGEDVNVFAIAASGTQDVRIMELA